MADFLIGILAMGAVVFAASAFAKLRNRPAYRDYRAGLRATRLVPETLLDTTAAILAATETVTAAGLVVAAILLVTGSVGGYPLAAGALGVGTALTATLAAGVAVAVSRGTRAPCACFGVSSARPLGAAHVVRNVCLLVLLAAGLTGAGLAHTRPAPAGAVVAALAGLVVALLVARWDDLVSLFVPAAG